MFCDWEIYVITEGLELEFSLPKLGAFHLDKLYDEIYYLRG